MNVKSLLFILFTLRNLCANELFPLSIIHLNDMHARFEEVNSHANTCKRNNSCIGGYARVVTMVKELKDTRPNPIYLNAADNYQGTLWYNVFRWNITQFFLNLHPADVMTLGNHEFDDGIEGLVPFLKRIKTPIVSCNIDASLEPEFESLFTNSIIFDKYEQKVGVIGVTTTFLGKWGKAKILPEVENVRKEVQKLVNQGIKIIVLLSHSGLPVDREIAKNVADIDIIIGGHSHSFLYSGPEPYGPDIPVADYPTLEKNPKGKDVLIVQASAYTKYLGNITLYFNDKGEIQDYEGAPIFLAHEIKQDEEILEALRPWKEEILKFESKAIGNISFNLDAACHKKECSMGNLITDAMAHAFLYEADDNEWTGAAIAFQNAGGIRSSFAKGTIIHADAVNVLPFENNYHLMEMPGKGIREVLEHSVSSLNPCNFMQVSGIKVTYDLSRESSDRVVDLKVLCQACEMPKYEPIDDEKYYKVVVNDYIADGGDDFTMFAKYARNVITGPRDVDALSDYLQKYSPFVIPPLMGRITIRK